jgi:two-component system response regulator
VDNKKILLVEDNPGDIELTRRALQKAHVTNGLIVVEDGQEALDFFFGENACPLEELPVVVLLDLKLPRVDGLEVLRRLRCEEKTRLIPVVVLTSSSEERDIIDSYNLGANSYVRKPVRFSEFAEAIGSLGLYWLILNRPAPNGRQR